MICRSSSSSSPAVVRGAAQDPPYRAYPTQDTCSTSTQISRGLCGAHPVSHKLNCTRLENRFLPFRVSGSCRYVEKRFTCPRCVDDFVQWIPAWTAREGKSRTISTICFEKSDIFEISEFPISMYRGGCGEMEGKKHVRYLRYVPIIHKHFMCRNFR